MYANGGPGNTGRMQPAKPTSKNNIANIMSTISMCIKVEKGMK